jgi:hypothetical protein
MAWLVDRVESLIWCSAAKAYCKLWWTAYNLIHAALQHKPAQASHSADVESFFVFLLTGDLYADC